MVPKPEHGVWLFTPSFALAVAATILYLVPTVIQFYLTAVKYRSWYFIWVTIGGLFEVVGYAARIASTQDYNSVVSTVTLLQG